MITINGVTYKGNNIVVNNNKVIIDGVKVDTKDYKEINIVVSGNLNSLEVDSCNTISIGGHCEDIETTNGDVDVSGDVHGNVKTTNGDVTAKSIIGKVKTTNGDISCK